MGSRTARLAALIVLLSQFGGPTAGATGLCDCCGNGPALTLDCRSACAAAREEIPMCRPAVIYGGNAGRPPGDNALAVDSLKFLSMGHPDRTALERFRQWIELWRGRAEGKLQQALARSERGDGRDADFASAEAERDQVLVNYHHGMRRYLEMVRAGGPEQLEMALAAPLSARSAVRLMPREAAPRREAIRSQRAARQKAVAEKDVQQKALRVAVTTARVCTGNWVNAACAVP
jgi:hypothetical protein